MPKFKVILLALSLPFVMGGLVLLIWSIFRGDYLWQGVLIALGVFCITLGVSSYYTVFKTDSRFNKEVQDSSKSFCKTMENLIEKEK